MLCQLARGFYVWWIPARVPQRRMLMSYWENQSEQISVARRNIFISMGGEKCKSKRNVWGKKRLADQTLYFKTQQSCTKLKHKQQILPGCVTSRVLIGKSQVVGQLPSQWRARNSEVSNGIQPFPWRHSSALQCRYIAGYMGTVF